MQLMVLSVLLGLILLSGSSYGLYFENFFERIPEVFMNASEIVKYNEYSFEEYWVTTKDGYILYLLRIPPTKNPTTEERPVALLTHGFLDSCDIFLLAEKQNNLPFYLADNGVDVWLGNNRGTRYSQTHTSLNSDQFKFWDFSLNEMAEHDLKSMIDYVTEKTKSEQIFYIGLSQGSALGFAKFGEDEEVAKKVKHFVAIAPIAKVKHTKTFMKYLVPMAKPLKLMYVLTGKGKFELSQRAKQFSAIYGCAGPLAFFCKHAFFAIVGSDYEHMEEHRLPVIQAHSPDSTSIPVILHWTQMVKFDKFQKYDFGSKAANRRHYDGKDKPPSYEPRKINIPVTFIRGENDLVCDEQDVSWLAGELGEQLKENIVIKGYNHMDMTLAKDAKDLVYPKIIKIITGKKEV